jgi:hypothetical protein
MGHVLRAPKGNRSRLESVGKASEPPARLRRIDDMWHDVRMASPIPRNPLAAGLLAYSLWQKLPPAQRRLLLEAARTHGPRIAAAAATAAKARKRP